MTRFTPLWQQAGSYAASVDRGLLSALWPTSAALGVAPSAVTNTMNITIPPGTAAVALQAGAGTAICRWDAAEVVTSPTAPPAGNTRIDIVICQVRDPQLDAGVNNDFIFQVISGANSTGTPVAPAIPANAMAMAQYTVPASVANLNGVTILDARAPIGTPLGLTGLVDYGYARIPVGSSGGGLRDVTVNFSKPWPFPTLVSVTANGRVGFSGGALSSGSAQIYTNQRTPIEAGSGAMIVPFPLAIPALNAGQWYDTGTATIEWPIGQTAQPQVVFRYSWAPTSSNAYSGWDYQFQVYRLATMPP